MSPLSAKWDRSPRGKCLVRNRAEELPLSNPVDGEQGKEDRMSSQHTLPAREDQIDHRIKGKLVDGLAPGIDGEQDMEVELEESDKQPDNDVALPKGEFRKNEDLQPGAIDQRPAAMRPPSNYGTDENPLE
jgi:hypothetical protein